MPRAFLKPHRELLSYADKICGRVTAENAGLIAHKFSSYLKATPDLDAYRGETSRDRYFSALGLVYGLILEKSYGWKPCWLIFEENRYNNQDGVDSIVSSDHKYVVYPIALVRADFYKETNFSSLLFGKIGNGELPNVPSGSFLDICKYLKDSEEALKEIETEFAEIMIADKGCFSENAYQKFIEKWESPLPEDYLAFLRSGANLLGLEKNFFWVVKDVWGSGWDNIFTMREDAEAGHLFQVFHWKGIPLIPRLLPIGGDGSFGYVLMSFREHEIGAIYYCMTYSERGALREGGEYQEGQGYWKIANSFLEFVNSLTENPDE